jgi:arginine decarboxylase
MKITPDSPWSAADSRRLYGIDRWGDGRFSINDSGQVCVQVEVNDRQTQVPLPEIINGIRQRGYALPVLVRFVDLLDDSLRRLHQSFAKAIAAQNYKADYRGVFPVKVNQQRQVIEEITRIGGPLGHGLEAGSKAELVLALACLPETGLLILNGYKDSEFLDLGLWATRLGHQCFFVIESPGELPLLIERSKALGVRPLIGVRTKVSTKVGGLWTETSGDRSSFGLSTPQLLDALDQLKAARMLDCLQLLHCHLGSQIPDIEDIRTGVLETCRFYSELAAEGAPLGYIDFGGGLAIDYTGSKKAPNSRNYDLDCYCQTLVATIRECLDPLEITHPQIITESGRATVADSSVLLFNVLGAMHFEASGELPQIPKNSARRIRELAEILDNLERKELGRSYQQAVNCRDDVRDDFRAGKLGMRQRALSENLFLAIARRILDAIPVEEALPPELVGLRRNMADIYYGNFSVFQSLPDTWAIGQVFPLLPIDRHNEPPCRDAMISDLTCDCDGKLDNFDFAGIERPTLPLHPLRNHEDYILGVFLMGAYQETLGDLHNLFGDTHTLNVKIAADGSFDLQQEIEGDSIGELLGYVEYDPRQLSEKLRDKAEQAVRSGRLNAEDRRSLLLFYRELLQGYSYFKDEKELKDNL